MNQNIGAEGLLALNHAHRMGSGRLQVPQGQLHVPPQENRLAHGGQHFLDHSRYQHAAGLLKAVLAAREATPDNPLSADEVLLTLMIACPNAEARAEVMNNANILPAAPDASTIHRRRDAAGVWFYHLQRP